MRSITPNIYKWLLAFLGGAFIVWGARVIVVTRYFSGRYDRVMDHTNVRWPLGISLILLGIFIVYKAMKEPNARQDLTGLRAMEMICVTCQTPCITDTQQQNTCPQCGGELELLYGFYDRHPEMKDE